MANRHGCLKQTGVVPKSQRARCETGIKKYCMDCHFHADRRTSLTYEKVGRRCTDENLMTSRLPAAKSQSDGLITALPD